MSGYKLSYFNITALAEPARFLFSYGNIPFEDDRFEREQWPSLKSKMPMGQVPVLEHNGKIAHQSVAICRYIGKLVKLVGKDDWEDLEIDAAVDTVNDLRRKIADYFYEPDESVKAARGEKLFKEILPFYLEKLDCQVAKNNGFLAVGRLTWADLYFVALLDYLNLMAKKDLTEDHPNLQKLDKTVLDLPQIKAWIEKRPQIIY